MSNSNFESRLEVLEDVLSKLQANFVIAGEITQELGGSESAYQQAVLALIASHPDLESFRGPFAYFLEDGYQEVLNNSNNEFHVSGYEAARKSLIAEFDKAVHLRSKAEPPK